MYPGSPSPASLRSMMVRAVTGWAATRQSTPSNASGNWVIAAKVELAPGIG